MSTDTILTVGIFQPLAGDEPPAARLRRLEEVFEQPAARACDLVLCPELYLSGYFAHDRITEWAESQDGPFAAGVCALAARNGCAIMYGYPERAGGVVYNAALCAGADGTVLANHRKNVLPYDYEERYFERGDRPTIVHLKGWRIGLLICYEVEFPEHVRYYARAGCDLVLAPTALVARWTVVARRVIPARAFENTVFVAYANYAGEEDGNRFLGESVIASPLGEDLARAGADEAFISARLSRADIAAARDRLHFLCDLDRSCYR
jgi:5-aminopentanamidase